MSKITQINGEKTQWSKVKITKRSWELLGKNPKIKKSIIKINSHQILTIKIKEVIIRTYNLENKIF